MIDRTAKQYKLVFMHHFSRSSITGVAVMMSEIMRRIPQVDPNLALGYQSYEGLHTPADLAQSLTARHSDASCLIGINLQIEVDWPLTLGAVEWCKARDVAVYNYIHDYWPHHRERLDILARQHRVGLLASTPHVVRSLAEHGFDARLVNVGVPIADQPCAAATAGTAPKIIASAGRLVPRKRFADIVRAFLQVPPADESTLYLRLFPSLVYEKREDDQQFAILDKHVTQGGASGERVRLHRNPPGPLDYAPFSIYVCASEYEGFSMTVIEAAHCGCPPLMSDIPPHRDIAQALFAEHSTEFLFPVGDVHALTALLRDEIAGGRRRALLAERHDRVRATIASRWSLTATARALADVARVSAGSPLAHQSQAPGPARGP